VRKTLLLEIAVVVVVVVVVREGADLARDCLLIVLVETFEGGSNGVRRRRVTCSAVGMKVTDERG
jgi:hypothetical protein